MKLALARTALAVALIGICSTWLAAKEPAAEGKVRILLTSGGHKFEEEPFYAMFDGMKNVTYTKALMPDDAGLLKPGLEKEYDCIVMYDMCKTLLTAEQQAAFVGLLEGGIGLVSLHHNLGAHRDWEEFRKIIDGKFIFGDETIDGRAYTKTPWSHGEEIPVRVVDKKHPITRGVKKFTIHDETYGKFHVAEGVHVLLTTDHPKNNRELAWTTQYGASPVYFLMLGHDGQAYGNPNFAKLLEQGIVWASQR